MSTKSSEFGLCVSKLSMQFKKPLTKKYCHSNDVCDHWLSCSLHRIHYHIITSAVVAMVIMCTTSTILLKMFSTLLLPSALSYVLFIDTLILLLPSDSQVILLNDR